MHARNVCDERVANANSESLNIMKDISPSNEIGFFIKDFKFQDSSHNSMPEKSDASSNSYAHLCWLDQLLIEKSFSNWSEKFMELIKCMQGPFWFRWSNYCIILVKVEYSYQILLWQNCFWCTLLSIIYLNLPVYWAKVKKLVSVTSNKVLAPFLFGAFSIHPIRNAE